MEKTNEKWIYVIIAAVLLAMLISCGTPRLGGGMTEKEVIEQLERYKVVNEF